MPLSIDHANYLKQVLKSKKLKLENENLNLRIYLAENAAITQMLESDIQSIERQLESVQSEDTDTVETLIVDGRVVYEDRRPNDRPN